MYPGQLEINGDLCCAHDGIPPEVMELEWLGNYTDKVEVLPYTVCARLGYCLG